MEIFAEFSHVVMFAKILFCNRLLFVSILSNCLCMTLFTMCTYMGLITYIYNSNSQLELVSKKLSSSKMFSYVCWLFHRISSHLEWYVSFSVCVGIGPVRFHYLSYRLSVLLLHFCYFFKHFPLLHHCHWFPVVSNCTQSTQKVFWFDGSNLYFSGFVGITTANQPSAKCKMMAMGKRLQFFNCNSNNNNGYGYGNDNGNNENRQKKYILFVQLNCYYCWFGSWWC